MGTIGAALRRAREQRGWNQLELAERLPSAQTLVSKRENDKLNVPSVEIERFVTTTGVPLLLTPQGWQVYEPPAQALPYYGPVPCGHPLLIEDPPEEELSVADLVGRDWQWGRTYLLRADGDSMTDAGILHGDLLVVDRKRDPRPGDIIVACLNGCCTVKRLALNAHTDRWQLVPAHPDYKPTDIEDWDEVVHQGVVVGRMRYTALG